MLYRLAVRWGATSSPFLTQYGVKISTILNCMALQRIVVPILHWSHNMEGSQFTASMNREMLHGQYPLYKYILVCEFCFPQFHFWFKLNQSGASRVILCWIHLCRLLLPRWFRTFARLSFCPFVKPTVTRTCWNSLLRLPIWYEELRLRVDMQLSQIKEDDYQMSPVPYFFTLLNIDCYINIHCIGEKLSSSSHSPKGSVHPFL